MLLFRVITRIGKNKATVFYINVNVLLNLNEFVVVAIFEDFSIFWLQIVWNWKHDATHATDTKDARNTIKRHESSWLYCASCRLTYISLSRTHKRTHFWRLLWRSTFNQQSLCWMRIKDESSKPIKMHMILIKFTHFSYIQPINIMHTRIPYWPIEYSVKMHIHSMTLSQFSLFLYLFFWIFFQSLSLSLPVTVCLSFSLCPSLAHIPTESVQCSDRISTDILLFDVYILHHI